MFKYLIFLILLCVQFLYARDCNDCVVYTSCPNALEQAMRHENPSTFTNAFCGYDTSQPKRRAPKVCCSDFADVKTFVRFGHTKIADENTTTAKPVCDDCIVYTSCPRAMESFRKRKNQKIFKSSFCGYEASKPPVSKVCCSAFDEVPIERHPNARLLPTTDCGDINGRRIVGGTIAGLYEFPWMALVAHRTKYGVEFKCGGSIINSRYILTAAHCVREKTIAGVRVGEHDLRRATDCQGSGSDYICESHIQDIPVERSIVHENYSKFPDVVNDIALLRLKDMIDFSFQNVAPVCLPATDKMRNISLDNRIATVAGWGLTEQRRDSCFLRKVDIPIVERNVCINKYERVSPNPGTPKNIDINQICAGERYKDSCNGDSGGPLMLESEYQGAYRIVQYGIVSHGPKECGSDTPGVYTDVSKYMDWILDNIRE